MLLNVVTNSTTKAPPTSHAPNEDDVNCPFLTRGGFDETKQKFFCDYTAWAYGIFALIGLLLIVVPLLLVICCVIKRKSRKRLRRLTSDSSYASSGLPYQPLRQDDKSPNYHNYGAVEHNERLESPLCTSPSNDGATEHSTEQSTRQPDSYSVASKASLFPNYDSASLNNRNALIANRPRVPSPSNLQRSQDKANQNTSNNLPINRDRYSPLTSDVVPDSSSKKLPNQNSVSNSAVYPKHGPAQDVIVAFKPSNYLISRNKNTERNSEETLPEAALYEEVDDHKEQGTNSKGANKEVFAEGPGGTRGDFLEKDSSIQDNEPTQERPVYNVLESPGNNSTRTFGKGSTPDANKEPLAEPPLYDVLEVPENVYTGKGSTPDSNKEPLAESPVYNVLEGPENNVTTERGSTPDSNKEPLAESPLYNVLEGPCNSNQQSGPESAAVFSPQNVPEEPVGEQCVPELQGALCNFDPDYATLEPPLPAIPGNDKAPETSEEAASKPEEDTLPGNADAQSRTPSKEEVNEQRLLMEGDGVECDRDEASEEGLYMPLIPPKAKQTGVEAVVNSSEGDQPRPRFQSRADYEEFLVDMVQSLPANERNGCYIVRDSITAQGSKVLTMYCKQPDSDKELYNFKVRFTDDNQAYLAKSKKRFPSLQDLLEFLKESKDMLPCTLRNSVLQES